MNMVSPCVAFGFEVVRDEGVVVVKAISRRRPLQQQSQCGVAPSDTAGQHAQVRHRAGHVFHMLAWVTQDYVASSELQTVHVQGGTFATSNIFPSKTLKKTSQRFRP